MSKIRKKGGRSCCIPNCNSHTILSKGISFHSFPRDIVLREEWIKRIRYAMTRLSYLSRLRRKTEQPLESPLNWQPSKTSIVCGLHFQKSGKKLWDDLVPTFIGNFVFTKRVPVTSTLFKEGNTNLPVAAAFEIVENKIVEPSKEIICENLAYEKNFIDNSNCNEDVTYSLDDHAYCSSEDYLDAKPSAARESALENKLNLLKFEVKKLESEKCLLNERVQLSEDLLSKSHILADKRLFRFENVSQYPRQLEFYTGMKSVEEFNKLYSLLEPDLPSLNYGNSSKPYVRKSSQSESKQGRPLALDYKNQLFLVLMRIKVGLMKEDLAYRFQLNKQTVGNFSKAWIDLIYKRFPNFPVQWSSDAPVAME